MSSRVNRLAGEIYSVGEIIGKPSWRSPIVSTPYSTSKPVPGLNWSAHKYSSYLLCNMKRLDLKKYIVV